MCSSMLLPVAAHATSRDFVTGLTAVGADSMHHMYTAATHNHSTQSQPKQHRQQYARGVQQ